jgi:hypothetical protein
MNIQYPLRKWGNKRERKSDYDGDYDSDGDGGKNFNH